MNKRSISLKCAAALCMAAAWASAMAAMASDSDGPVIVRVKPKRLAQESADRETVASGTRLHAVGTLRRAAERRRSANRPRRRRRLAVQRRGGLGRFSPELRGQLRDLRAAVRKLPLLSVRTSGPILAARGVRELVRHRRPRADVGHDEPERHVAGEHPVVWQRDLQQRLPPRHLDARRHVARLLPQLGHRGRLLLGRPRIRLRSARAAMAARCWLVPLWMPPRARRQCS